MHLALLAALPIQTWELVRVDTPDHPDAEATSAHGSTLLSPPAAGPWRVEPVPVPDLYVPAMATPDALPDETAGEGFPGWPAFEALEALHVDPWHAAGIDGAGVKVAVFDLQWFGTDLYPHLDEMGEVETHDCFRHRSCDLPIDHLDPRYGFESGGHGVACAQVIRDVAPGVELHLVRVSSLTTLENAVDWAIREGIDVVSMSMSFFNESFYDGTGSINEQMDELAAAGVLMVTSAGNYATESRLEAFHDTDGDGLHEFPWGSEYLPVEYGAGGKRVFLTWDDFTNCGDTDLDLYAYDADGVLIGRSTDEQRRDGENCSPVERMSANVPERGWIYVQVHRKAGSPNVDFSVMARGGSVYERQPFGSVTDPGTHAAVLTVGAIRANDTYAVNPPEGFSSLGPTMSGLPKPDVGGPNGLTSTIYGPSNFYGTSASTPAVAGAIALILSADPRRTPFEAADFVVASALHGDDVRAPRDPGLGAGAARLPPPQTLDGAAGCGGAAAVLGLLPGLGLLRRRRQSDTLPARHDP